MTKEYRDYLAHFGILGQKWGRRRYQNEDGSLTPEGYARYVANDGKLTKKGRKLAGDDASKISGDSILNQWARYQNFGDMSKKGENTYPLVKEYRKELERIRGNKKDKNIVNYKTGEFNDKEFEKRNASYRKVAEIANKSRDWIGDLAGAMLKDMGYNDTKKSRAWLKKQAWMKELWLP